MIEPPKIRRLFLLIFRVACYLIKKPNTMARNRRLILSKPTKSDFKQIKVRLDHRTVINVGNATALEFWKKRYPKLQVIG